MRCKNCGTENDDNRYICENCGSPLYDENEIAQSNDNGATMTFGAIKDKEDEPARKNGIGKEPQKKPSDNKNIIVIAILAVVLIAIIASVIIISQGKSKDRETTASTESTTASTTVQEPGQYTDYTTERTTEKTTKETTTKKETTTTTTTAPPVTYSVKLISQGGGTVDGSGTYTEGENVTIVATPDESYEFDGWYSGGKKLSSSTTYSFTASKNVSISAVFNEITTADNVENVEGELD